MTKRLSYHDRKRLLEASRSGLSSRKLKVKFGISDDRTLRRHLKMAEQEEEAKVIKLEILKGKLVSHLDEVSNLIGEWKSSLSTPRVSSIYYDMPNIPTQDIEVNPLFGSLKSHLPFPVLWRNYATWKTKVRSYVEGCQQIMKGIGEAEKCSIPEDIFKLWGTEPTTKAIELHEPLKGMMKKYGKAAEADPNLKSLLEQLKPIETRMQESLQEIQFRHDHITYSCKLCPGQPRLSR